MSRILEPNLESDSGAEFLGLPGEDAPSVYCREGLYNAFFLCFENSKIVSLTNKIARGFLSNLGSCSYQKVFFFSLGLELPYVLDLLCCPKHACLQNFYIFQLDV